MVGAKAVALGVEAVGVVALEDVVPVWVAEVVAVVVGKGLGDLFEGDVVAGAREVEEVGIPFDRLRGILGLLWARGWRVHCGRGGCLVA